VGNQSRGEFEASLAHGRTIEQAVARWLMSNGYLILPVYDYSGKGLQKAPKLQAADIAASLVVPDLLAARNGTLRWVEVKWKSRADFTWITQRRETGIDNPLWKDYLEVQRITGHEVWLVFVHEQEREIIGNKLDALKPHARWAPKFQPRGGQFFPCEKLIKIVDWDVVFPPGAEAA
jgi:hypothetical protein